MVCQSPGAEPVIRGILQGGGIIVQKFLCLGKAIKCVIDLVDKYGNSSCEVQEGRMNATSHQSVLHVLEHHASRYQCKGKLSSVDNNLVSWAIDETRMVNLSLLLNGTEANKQATLVDL